MHGSSTPLSSSAAFWRVLPWVVFISGMFFISYGLRALMAPMLPYLQETYNLSVGETGQLTLYQAAGLTVGMLSAGVMISLVQPRYVISASIIIGGLVTMSFSQVTAIWQLEIGYVVLGFFCGWYFTAGMTALMGLVSMQNWAKAITVHELGPALSFIMMPLIANSMVAAAGWKGAFFWVGGGATFLGILFLLFGRGGLSCVPRPSLGGVRLVLQDLRFWAFVWLFILGIVGEFAPYSILSLYLTAERAYTPDAANYLLGMSRIFGPLAVILGGLVVGKIGGQRTLLLYCVLHALTLVFLTLPIQSLFLLGVYAQPLLTAFAFPAVFVVLNTTFSKEKQPLVLVLSSALGAFFGAGLSPTIMAYCGELLDFSWSFYFLAALYLCSAPLVFFMRDAAPVAKN